MEQYIEKLTPLFQKVAEKIGQGAEFGYEVVYRQQITYGIIALFIAICGVSLFFTGLKLKVSKQEWEYGEGKSVLKVLLIILGSVATIAGSIHAILYLTNPHYYAIQFFINLVK